MAIQGAFKHPVEDLYYGDQANTADSENLTALGQVITGDAEVADTWIYGDVMENNGDQAILTGGDDTIRASARGVIGDAGSAGGSSQETIGGDDLIEMRLNLVDSYYFVSGDVWNVTTSLVGGDDTIVGFRQETRFGLFYGDAESVFGGGTAQGGNDIIKGTNGVDNIFGDFATFDTTTTVSAGNDRLWGYGGDDQLFGDAKIVGENFQLTGDDVIRGGAGNDWIYGDAKVVRDSNGTEIYDPTLDLMNFGGNDKLFGQAGNDQMWGGGGKDRMMGNAGDDILYGGQQRDVLRGGKGNDELWGGRGNDRLEGGGGVDILKGGKGRDHFIFKEGDSRPGASDRIKDFKGAGLSSGDLIDVSAIDANAGLAGDQAFTFDGGQGRGSLWAVNKGNATLILGNTDDDAQAEIRILIQDGAAVDASDYFADDFIL